MYIYYSHACTYTTYADTHVSRINIQVKVNNNYCGKHQAPVRGALDTSGTLVCLPLVPIIYFNTITAVELWYV